MEAYKKNLFYRWSWRLEYTLNCQSFRTTYDERILKIKPGALRLRRNGGGAGLIFQTFDSYFGTFFAGMRKF